MRIECFELEVVQGVAHLTLDRPERGNPIDAPFCAELRAIANDLAGRVDVRAVLLKSRGKYFSVGGDVQLFSRNLETLPNKIYEWTADLHVAIARLLRLNAPLVASVHADAMGGAAALIAHCDLVYCASTARLGAAYSRIGYSCDAGSSVAFAARMGLARARRFVLLGEVLDAEEAARAGLVDHVVEDASLLLEATGAATRLSRGPTRAYGETRRLFSRALAQPLESQLEEEAQALARVAATEDAREGIMAFVEKRAPVFHGR